jgi:hypothetical protein
MLDKIIATFCLLDDLLKILHHRNAPQAKIPDREMLAIAILACQAFGGSRRQALQWVKALQRFSLWRAWARICIVCCRVVFTQ